MPTIDDTPPIRIPLNALYRYGSRVLVYRGRAQDKLRQHLFVDQENVCDHMTDRQFVERLSAEEMRSATPDELDGAETCAGTKRLSLASPAPGGGGLQAALRPRMGWRRSSCPNRGKT